MAGKKKIKLHPSKNYIEAIEVGPVWTRVVLKLRTGLLAYQGYRMKPRRPRTAARAASN